MENNKPPYDGPFYAVTYSCFDEVSACVAFRCLPKLFFIQILMDDIHDWSKKQQFQQLLENADYDIQSHEAMQDLIWDHFLPVVKSFDLKAPSYILSPLTLQEFYTTEILAYDLTTSGADAKFVPTSLSSGIAKDLLPQMKLEDIADGSKVKCIDATSLQIRPEDLGDPYAYSDTPRTVCLGSSPTLYYFKPVNMHTSFSREVAGLVRIAENRLDKKYRLPVLHALVTYSDRPDTVMGMLLKNIDHDGTLMDRVMMNNPSRKLKDTWCRQIENTMQALHRHDIIWGDVKPENVLIDRDQNAWVVDFGGGYNSGFVDEDLMETLEGDKQGVSRIKEMLLTGKQFTALYTNLLTAQQE